jgi:DNA polymerase
MTTLYLDFETYSATPIKHGTYKYCENAEIMLATYAIDDGPVHDIDMTIGDPHDVWLLQDLLAKADVIIAHNSMFDRSVLRLGNLKIEVPIEKWRCSMVKALLHGLPGGLDKLCEILKVPTEYAKLKDGRALVLKFCKPTTFTHKLVHTSYPSRAHFKAAVDEARAGWQGRATRETHPAEWARFVEYARNDISAMREVWKRLPSWNYSETGAGAMERGLWHLDQKINDRGVLTDQALVASAIRATDAEQLRLKRAVSEHTDGYVGAATQRDRMIEFIFAEYGIGMDDLTKAGVGKMLDMEDLDPMLRTLLELRQQASRSSTAKYKAFQRAANTDDRVRGMLQFSGAARTRRDAGRTVQLQNLGSRGLLPQDQIEVGVLALKAGVEDLL